MITRPDISDYPEFQRKYIALVPDDVIPFLQEQKRMFLDYIVNLTDAQLDHKYADDKWTIRQVILHIIDTEQVFTYRTLAVSRGDTQNLSGFDQDIYIDNYNSAHLMQSYLNKFFAATRDSFLTLAEGMQEADWNKVGNMSSYTMKLSAMPYMIAGHLDHHMNILKERY